MKQVLVTGGSRGLGFAICRRLLDDGYYVITASRQVSAELAALLRSRRRRLRHHAVDFADPGAAARLAREARLLDGVDAYVANAAVAGDGLLALSSESALAHCVQVNLTTPMLITREVIKGMLQRKGGSLVFIASVAARSGFSGLAAYSATKGGLVSFSRTLAREYGEQGIRSNAILPGFLQTDMTARLSAALQQSVIRRTALKRLGTVDDVVGVVSFLLSQDSSYLTGTEITADGGFTA